MNYNSVTNSQDGLPSLLSSGRPPESRITSCEDTRNLALQWIRNDQESHGQQRGRVTGLIQGNPPYSTAKMIKAGRRDGFNINIRNAEAYEETAMAAIYDLFSEAPTLATVKLDADPGDDSYDQDPNAVVERSNIVTEEFDYLLKSDRSWDSTMQNSIRNTVRFGAGPLVFENATDWRNRHLEFNCLVVPDDASSDINRWEAAVLLMDYLPHQLYEYIRNPEAAEAVGWNVSETRNSIINAAPDTPGAGLNWEGIQQQLKQNSYSWSARSKVIQCVHFFAREFPEKGKSKGKISHVIFVLSPQSPRGTAPSNPEAFLFREDRVYEDWQECIHPMYYSQGQGGKHYGVTGQGVKMFGMLEAENRIFNNMLDKAMAPKIMFRPTTASSKQKALPTRHGDFMILPDGYDMQQLSINSMIEEGLAIGREVRSMVSANLSTYRQNLETPKQGNPITRGEAEIRAADQSRLGKTQHNRYYEQLDWLYKEKFRRACNPKLTAQDPGGEEALEFQRKCEERGVPRKSLLQYCTVKATRVVGQGSQYLRQQTLDFFLGIVGALPEEGRENVIRDAIASRAGQYMVERYFPRKDVNKLASDQQAEAVQMVACMKVGIPAMITSTQNPMIFAQTFLQAASQALQSVQQAGPQGIVPHGTQVVGFLQLCGSAIAAHLQRMANDPTRSQAVPKLEAQFKQLGAATDKLKGMIQQVMQKQQKEAQARQQKQMAAGKKMLEITNGQDPDLIVGLANVNRMGQIKEASAQASAALKTKKQGVDQALKVQKARQDLIIQDAVSAAEITRKNREHKSKLANATKE